MKRICVIFVAAALLAGCGSIASGVKGVDWAARESEAAFSGPLEFGPESEPLGLRIPLLYAILSERSGVIDSRQSSRSAPFGVSLGNGVAIDSQGNLFLDVLRLLKIDTGRSFSVTCRSNDLSNNITTFVRDENGVRLSSPFYGKGSVVMDGSDMTLKTATGQNRFQLTKKGDTLSYKSTVLFDTAWDCVSSDSTITVSEHGLLGHAVAILKEDAAVLFNADGATTLPVYSIGKTGDTYFIEYQSTSATMLYKLYITDRSLYLVRSGNILVKVVVTDSAILVNGVVVVTYSVP